MKKRRIAVPAMAAVMAALLAMVIGAGYAFAQEEDAQSGQQIPGRGGRGPMGGRHIVGGEVIKVEGNTITLKTIRTGEEKAINVDDQTKYRKDGNEASLADVVPGENIGVFIGEKPEEGQTPLARFIIIGKPQDRPAPVVGTVSAISGDTVTVTTSEGDKQVKLPAITQGMRIAVMTAPDGTVRGILYNPPERPEGAPFGPPAPPADNAEGAVQDNA